MREKPGMRPRAILTALVLSAAFWFAILGALLLSASFAIGQQPPPPSIPPTPVPCANGVDGCRMISVVMIVDGPLPRAFTELELGIPFAKLTASSQCQGRLARGSLRYFVNKTAPSATVGTLVPPAPETRDEDRDPTGTLEEDGTVILLYSGDLIAGFKAIAATTTTAELTWDCQL